MSWKNETSPEVYLGKVRLFNSGKLDRKPADSELTTDLGELWAFIERFIQSGEKGMDAEIKEIEIHHRNKTECNCGAILEKRKDDVPEKLKEPCCCKGSDGIITFKTPRAAEIFRKKIRSHKKMHTQGLKDLNKKNQDGSVSFCDICCFKNKQIRSIRERPGPEEGASDNLDEIEESSSDVETDIRKETAITENQVRAIGMVLNTSLGECLFDEANVIKEAVRGKIPTEVRKLITNTVNSVFNDLSKKNLFPERSPDNVKKTISFAVSKLVLDSTDEACIGKVVDWVKKFKTNTDDEVSKDDNDDDKKVADDLEREQVDAAKAGVRTLLTEIEELVATEENLNAQYTGIKAMLLVTKDMDLEASEAVIGAEETLKSMIRYENKAMTIFAKLEPEDSARLSENHLTTMATLTDAIKALRNQIKAYKFDHGGSSVEPEKSKRVVEKEQDLPSKTEIHQDIRRFESCRKSFKDGVNEIQDIINDEDVDENKNEFNIIQTRIKPDLKEAMSTMSELAKRFKKWLRMSGLDVSKETRKKLEEKVSEELEFSIEWNELGVKIAKVDRKFGHSKSSHEASGLGGILNKIEIEPFYGEEPVPGKKWQNIFEWIKKIEMEVVRMISNKSSQLHEVMKYLSPNIQKIAKAHRPEFKTYEELKTWLIEHHVNEVRIVRELQNRIASVVPKKVKDVEGFILHTRGILASIEEHCESHPRLKESLFSEKNVTALIKFVLGRLSAITKRDEFMAYLLLWVPFRKKMEADGLVTTPEQELKKMDEQLDHILELAKAHHEHNQRLNENYLNGPQSQQDQEEFDDDNAREGFEDEQSEAGSENEDERESGEEDAEAKENFCIKCHSYFVAVDFFAQFDYGPNYDGWVCCYCYESENPDDDY